MSGRKENSVPGSVNLINLRRGPEFNILTLFCTFIGLQAELYMGEALGSRSLSL